MNPWLEIPLEEYEAHMSMATVAQAQHLARVLGELVHDVKPTSVAIIGCAGGNGFDQLPPELVHRVVGVDINPEYIAAARRRYGRRFDHLELVCYDLLSLHCAFEPVDLVFAGLVFEYVDYVSGLSSMSRFIASGGYLSVILQLPSDAIAAVSPSPCSSLSKLNSLLTFVSPESLEGCARSLGLCVVASRRSTLGTGKAFHEFLFRRGDASGS
jgi:ubiquinone/menaquinone biosynthesis C-methylase UbiE